MQDLADGVAVNWWAVVIGVGTFLVILAFHRWLPRFPGTLVALALGVAAGYVLPVDTIGEFSLGAPQFSLEPIPLDVLGELLLAAAAIAVVAYTDVIVTARAFAGDQRVDANRETDGAGSDRRHRRRLRRATRSRRRPHARPSRA